MRCPKCGNNLIEFKCARCGFDVKKDEIVCQIGTYSNAVQLIEKYIRENEEAKAAAEKEAALKRAIERAAAEHAAAEKVAAERAGAERVVAEREEAEKAAAERVAAEKAARLAAEKDRQAARKVTALIDDIGSVEHTEDCGQKIRAARFAYSNLTLSQRVLVKNEPRLTAAQNEYDILKKKADFQKKQRKYRNRILFVCAVLAICIGAVVLLKSGILFNRTHSLTDAFFDSAKQGDTFELGKFEQDNNLENGPESIEWIVVKSNDDLILAMSKYVLDNRPYNDTDSYEATDWEHCTLRQWLNEDFYSTAFTEEEKQLICATNLQNHDTPGFFLPGGNNTVDHVFLLSCGDITSNYDDYEFLVMNLSWEDVNGEMSLTTSNQSEYDLLKATQTEYAKNRYYSSQLDSWKWKTEENVKEDYTKLEEEYGNNTSSWWLRTRGDNWYSNIVITWSGSALADPSQSASVGVRPAILVSRKRQDNSEGIKIDYDSASESFTTTIDDEGKQYAPMRPKSMLFGNQQVCVILEDGKVLQIAQYRNKVFNEWPSIQKVVASQDVVVGLTEEGKVVISAEGSRFNGIETLDLEDVVDICFCDDAIGPNNDQVTGCIICLTSDGIAYFTYADGYKGHEKNVRSISACSNKFALVFNDGTVSGYKYDNDAYSEVPEWSDIVQVVCGDTYIAGLKEDGTVVVSGGYLSAALNGSTLLLYDGDFDGTSSIAFDVSNWQNIVSIAGGEHHLVGLCSDGTVVSAGLNTYGQCNTEIWDNFVSIEASGNTTIAFKENGEFWMAGKDVLANIIDLYDKFDACIGYSN